VVSLRRKIEEVDPAFVTIHFRPVSLAVRLRRGWPKLAFAGLLLAASPVVVGRVGALIGGDGSSFERMINWGIIGFPVIAIAFASVVSALKAGTGTTVTFSERGLHEHDSPNETVHPWSFVREALEDDGGLELRCGYGMGLSATSGIPANLLLPRSVPEYERVRGLVAAHAGERLRSGTLTA
jgi:hypothetical protein